MSKGTLLNFFDEKVNNFKNSPHAALVADSHAPLGKHGCEACHGPGFIHRADNNAEVISYTKMDPKESAAACLRCHEKTLSESHWKKTAHADAGLTCVSCHQIHTDSENPLAAKTAQLKDTRSVVFAAKVEPNNLMLKAPENVLCGQCHAGEVAKFRLNTHHPIPEGRMNCSDCHSVHPTKHSTMDAKQSKDACVKCHSEYAGPFVYEHEPVAGNTGGGCLECHNPHGSSNPSMLNSFSRGLCAQCHSDKLSNHHPGLSCWSAGCHVSTHGSNTDPTFRQP